MSSEDDERREQLGGLLHSYHLSLMKTPSEWEIVLRTPYYIYST